MNPPRGMRDFLPAEKARREAILGVIRRVYRAHGFDEIETPVVEDSSRLHAGLGGDNEKLAYGVLKRGLTRDDLRAAEQPLDLADLGLRFDLTVPLARFYATHRAELPSVFRAIQIAPVWRAERPQKGRYRQFVQCDIDILGEPSVRAEAELLVASLDALDALGLEGGFLRVNDRRLLVGMLASLGFAPDETDGVLITIDKLDKIAEAGVLAELRERGATPAAVDALEAFLARPQTLEYLPFRGGRHPQGAPGGRGWRGRRRPRRARRGGARGARCRSVGGAAALRPVPRARDGLLHRPDLRTRAPSVGYSLGGGGRYDGMIGRFLARTFPRPLLARVRADRRTRRPARRGRRRGDRARARRRRPAHRAPHPESPTRRRRIPGASRGAPQET